MDFNNLKNSYIAAVRWGLAVKVGYQESKRGNDILHKFCENYIENSDYDKKEALKHEIELLKETLAKEIEDYYRRG